MTLEMELRYGSGVVHADSALFCGVPDPHSNAAPAPVTPDVVRHLESTAEQTEDEEGPLL